MLLSSCWTFSYAQASSDKDFINQLGKDMLNNWDVEAYRKSIGKEFDGKLKAYSDGNITIEDHSGENELTFTKKDMVWVKLDDFNI